MSVAVQEHVFEPFFTTKARGKGTGLGLAMVYGFGRQSGGTVRIYSEAGYGTSVSIYLPVSAQEGHSEPSVLQEGHEEQPVAMCALVVDDEPSLLEVAAEYLESMGIEAVTASNAEQALKSLDSHHFNLVITDMVMPGDLNGAELVARVRERQPGVHVVYCSGFPARALAERKMLHLEGPVVQKPYHRKQFVAAVREAQGRVMAAARKELS
jgi:CheY-like chemotaxis protein